MIPSPLFARALFVASMLVVGPSGASLTQLVGADVAIDDDARDVRVDLSGDRFTPTAILTIQRIDPYSECAREELLREGENRVRLSPATYRLSVNAPRGSLLLPDNLRADDVVINVPATGPATELRALFHMKLVPCIVAVIHVQDEPEPCDSQLALVRVPDQMEDLPEDWNADSAEWTFIPVGTPARVFDCGKPGRWVLAFRRRGNPTVIRSAPCFVGSNELKYIILDV